MSADDPRARIPTCALVLVILITGCHTGGSKDNSDTKIGPNHLLKCHTQVKLQGTIEQKTFPGPPNYDDITKSPEDYWILKLGVPIDVAMDPDFPVPDENKPSRNVREIQLILDYNKYRRFLGREVVVGSVWQGVMVHHKPAVLMEAESIERAEYLFCSERRQCEVARSGGWGIEGIVLRAIP